MSSVSVKTAETIDIETVVELFKAQLSEHEVQSTNNGLASAVTAVISNSHQGFILLAQLNGRPVGVSYVAALLSLEHEGIIGWLEELYTLPEHRNCGIGSRLLEGSISSVRQRGWKGVELEVMAGHERVGALYKRNGFSELKRSRFCKLF